MSTARKSSLLSKTADMEKFAAFKAAKAAAKEADRLRLAAEYPHLFGGSANANGKGKAERMTPNKRKAENDENMPNNTGIAPGSAKKPRAVNPSNLRTLPSKAQVQVLGGKKNVSFTPSTTAVLVSTRSSSSTPKEVEMEAFAPKPLPPVPAPEAPVPVAVPEEAQQQVEEVLDYLLTTSEVLPALHQRLSRQSASFASSLHRRSSLGVGTGALGDGEVLEKMRKVIFSLEESTAFTESSTPKGVQVQGVLDVDQLLDTAEEVVTTPPAPAPAVEAPATPSVVRYATTHPRAALLDQVMSRGLLIGEVSGHAIMSGHVKYRMNLSTLSTSEEVQVEGMKVVLWKRYSDCKNLHSTLTELIGQQQMMPLFPPKDPACDTKDGKQADPAALAARTEGLGLWLTGVLALQAAQGKGYRDALYGFISN